MLFFSPFCLPSGKADDTLSPSLPRTRSSLLQLRPWTPWIWGILNFRFIRVLIIWIFLFFACGSLSNIHAQEQNITTNHLWFDFYNYLPITDKLEYDGDLGFRHAYSDFPWSRIYFRPSLAYRWKEKIRFAGGIKFAYTSQDILANTSEIRPWLGIKIYWPKILRLMFQHFLRLEQRFQYNTGSDKWKSQTRLRYKLGTKVPINNPTIIDKTFYMPLWVEFFDNASGDLTERFASEVRLTAGLGYRFDKR